MEAVDIKALENAILMFYGTEDQRNAAHEWLQNAQSSIQAWSFVWELMKLDKPSEIQFFGATTLHSKLMKYWHEVPKENYLELKQKIFETIILFGKGPKIVLTRLCIALSAYIHNMIVEWPTAIQEITHSLQTEELPNIDRDTQTWLLMEVLCGIAEEISINDTSAHKVALRNEIGKHVLFVLNIVTQYMSIKCERELQEEDMNTLLRAAKCIVAWLKCGGFTLEDCQTLTTTLLQIVNKCYWSCLNSDGCMTCDENDLSEACLEALSTMMLHPDSHRLPNTAIALIKLFLDSLTNIIHAEWKEHNLNEDIAVGIYTLFVTTIECHSRVLLNAITTEDNLEHRDIYIRLINEILQCTDKPGIFPVEESCSVLSFGFWYMLQEEVFALQNEEHRKQGINLITPLYVHLSKILVRKSQQPDEISIEKWNSDDLEAFRCYRQDIADTLIYCHDVLNSNLLDILSSILDEGTLAIQNDPTNWTKLEASIFSFFAVAEHTDTFESKNVPKLMSLLTEIPYEKINDKVLGTSLETIGAYSEWFKDNPSYLPPAVFLLLKGLNSTMASQATLGLKDICRECQMHLANLAEPLLDACQIALKSGNLKNQEAVRLMFSIGRTMSTLSLDKISNCLNVMISPCFEELQEVIRTQTVITEPIKLRIVFRLDMISTLFSTLNIKTSNEDEGKTISDNDNNQNRIQPVLYVMQETMPIFKEICKLWMNEPTIIQALCEALKQAIVNLLNDVRPMLPDLCCLIISIYQTKCVPPALDIAKTCIILFHKDLECQTAMDQLLVEVTNCTLNLFDQTPENKLSEITENIETFYAVNTQLIKKLPIVFRNVNVNWSKIVHYAIIALTLPEVGTLKTSVSFLSHFVTQSRNHPATTAIVLEKGQDIIKTICLCIVTYTPRTHVDTLSDILLSINKKYPSEFIGWMRILDVPNFPSSHVNNRDKTVFMKNIIKEKVNKRLVQSHLREFQLKCRGLVQK